MEECRFYVRLSSRDSTVLKSGSLGEIFNFPSFTLCDAKISFVCPRIVVMSWHLTITGTEDPILLTVSSSLRTLIETSSTSVNCIMQG